ncbi:CoA-binding protein [Syntrophorhabdus aromaticivorans]|uniref:CoA-binding protein n=1 Tax=Syntrophorhabdus aromaticivorans TaxID=328301 RepID=A0A351TZ37_9BACT|nr:CoA-binding protein [Syntrophorhabdus aromaticivorans]NLW34612.1 CoA-binding protein [Syntrophorhabdus aromaticivorans]HBA52968.1 CoA-binding protein [Syntrophorhabdus aromaticivorans]
MESLDAKKKELLRTSKVIAMVGLSPDTDKPSNAVASYLKRAGYRVMPVNPQHDEILGEKSYKSLLDIPEKVDIVDIFMRSEKVVPIVEEAVRIKPRAIWLQEGIVNEEAGKIAEQGGIGFFQGICIKKEHARLLG